MTLFRSLSHFEEVASFGALARVPYGRPVDLRAAVQVCGCFWAGRRRGRDLRVGGFLPAQFPLAV